MGRILKLKEKILKLPDNFLDPNKEKNAQLRERYANDSEFKRKCEVRRLSAKIKKLEGKCYMCERPDKPIEKYHFPNLIIPLCKRCHAKVHHLLKLNLQEVKNESK